MKILIYSANFAPEPTGIGKYSGEMAVWLASQGHQVRVVAAPPYYPAWKISAGYIWPPYRLENFEGINIWRAPLWVPSQPGGLLRVIHLLSFALSSLPVMLLHCFWRPNVVFTVAPAFVCAPMGALTARLCGARAWLHVQDFEVDVAFRMGILKGRRLQKMVRGLERSVLRRFDEVSSISEKMVSLLAHKGVDPARCYHFPNWVDVQHIQPLTETSSYRQELGIAEDAVVMLFSGSLGSKQDLMLIPQAARKLAHLDKLVFVVCGDGVMKQELEDGTRDLRQFRLLPLQPFNRLSELLGLADAHLLTQSVDAQDLVLPSKLSGMLASGRPIIATCNAETEIGNVVSRCGLLANPGDVDSLANAIAQLYYAPDMRRTLGVQARQCALDSFTKSSVLQRMLKRMQTLH